MDNPRHLAIILDGNRRYAKKLQMKPWKGHKFGLRKLAELFDWCSELEIRELTLYAFSTENFNRDKREVQFLFDLFKNEFRKMESDKRFLDKDIKVNIIGNISMFPKDISDMMLKLVEKTKGKKSLVVNFALAYGGRQEIVEATRKILEKVKNKKIKPEDVDEKLLSDNMYLKSEPEIVIRPGGEIRTSNFLTWQSVYSEWFFIDKLWPEFTKDDLIRILDDYKKRERRFGK